jgi:hypothetical protein
MICKHVFLKVNIFVSKLTQPVLHLLSFFSIVRSPKIYYQISITQWKVTDYISLCKLGFQNNLSYNCSSIFLCLLPPVTFLYFVSLYLIVLFCFRFHIFFFLCLDYFINIMSSSFIYETISLKVEWHFTEYMSQFLYPFICWWATWLLWIMMQRAWECRQTLWDQVLYGRQAEISTRPIK